MSSTVEDVYTAALDRLRTNTGITWYEFQMPDNEQLDSTQPYGVLSVLGPFETHQDNNILGVEDQPMGGTLLVSVTALTTAGANAEMSKAVGLLRGWAPAETSALRTNPARGYEPVYSKFEPTLITRNVLFRFTTNL